MSPARGVLLASSVLCVVVVGCFRPNIQDGGFTCAEGAPACPDGFHCVTTDNRCYKADSGPEVSVCASPVEMPCNAGPAPGEACNPICQTGCPCGERCTVVNGATRCLAAGPKLVGELCDLHNDNCGAGFGCVAETCGTDLGRCYRFCNAEVTCPDSLRCSIPNGSFSVCDIAPQSCDATTGAGCPDPALACYQLGGATRCDCRGTAQLGDPCTFYNDCVPGLTCVAVGGGPAHCI
jgi:hypothetical protein